jgi:pimeloyl-ACP methyl ester carboxylesterase
MRDMRDMRDMREVTIGGLRIAYQQAGDGPPLVLLHGILDDSRTWRRQLEALADEFTVLAWDAPGCGASADPPEGFTLHDYAECLADWLAALGIERPHILGLSWGGTLALELYRSHPDLPASLLLTDTYAGLIGSLPPDVYAARVQSFLREADMPPEQFVPGWIPGLLSPSAPPGAADEVIAIMSDFHPTGYRRMVLGSASVDLRDVLPTIRVPTLLLWGDADKRSPVSVAEQFHAAIPSSRLVLIPGAGHLSNIDAPDQFNAAVRDFLHSLRLEPAPS